MKILFAIFVTAILSLSTVQAQQVQKTPTAAVMDFTVISGISKQEAAALTSKFRNSITKTKRFVVLERDKMDQILKAQDFSLSDACNSAECAVQVGQLLAAEKIITGDVGKVGETYTVTVRVVDVTSGRVETTESDEYRGSPDGLLARFDLLAQKITGTYKVSRTKWYILGGALAAGGAAAVFLLKPEKKTVPNPLFPDPPDHP